jgi:hypothetical protein
VINSAFVPLVAWGRCARRLGGQLSVSATMSLGLGQASA